MLLLLSGINILLFLSCLVFSITIHCVFSARHIHSASRTHFISSFSVDLLMTNPPGFCLCEISLFYFYSQIYFYEYRILSDSFSAFSQYFTLFYLELLLFAHQLRSTDDYSFECVLPLSVDVFNDFLFYFGY